MAEINWQTVAEAGSIGEFQSLIPAVQDIPPGAAIKIEFTLPWWMPIAGIADIAGAEWWARRFDAVNNSMIVDDVYGDGAYKVVIRGTAIGIAPVVIIAIVAAGLIALGLVCTTLIRLSADKVTIATLKATVATTLATEASTLASYGFTPEQIQDIFSHQSTATEAVNPPEEDGSTLGSISNIIMWGVVGFIAFQAVGAFKTYKGATA